MGFNETNEHNYLKWCFLIIYILYLYLIVKNYTWTFQDV